MELPGQGDVGHFVADGDWLIDLAHARVRAQLRWASAILFVGEALMPAPAVLFRVVSVLVPLALFTLSFTRISTTALSAIALVAIAAGGVIQGSGALAIGEGHPSAGLSVVVAALAVAGVHVAPRGRKLLAVALALSLVYYLWPSPARGPLAELARVLVWIKSGGSVWNRLGASALATLLLAPSFVVAIAWIQARTVRRNAPSLFALALFYGAPVLLAPMVSRAIANQRGDFAVLASLLLEVATLSALFVIVAVAASHAEIDAGRSSRARSAVFSLGLALFALAPWAFAKKPSEPWIVGSRSAAADRFFGSGLRDWNDAEGARLLPGRIATHAEFSGPQWLDSARSIDADLASAIGALTRARDGIDDKAWDRLVLDVNRASRHARLPYYVDPTESVIFGAVRWHRVDAYVIESSARFNAGDKRAEALLVRKVTERARATPLGLSRDNAGEALVFGDAIDAYAAELVLASRRDDGRCVKIANADATLDAALARCGSILSDETNHGDITKSLYASVTRHELEHQFDSGDPPVARTLARRTEARGLAVPPRINRELSAYLAELSASDASARVTLVRLLRLAVIDRTEIDGAAARIALELLAGVQESPNSAAVAFLRLADLDNTALRSRARETWKSEFGSALPNPVRV